MRMPDAARMIPSVSVTSFVEVRTLWALHHRWPPGQVHDVGPPITHALWLMLQGDALVHAEGQQWHVLPGMIYLSSLYRPRDILTPHGAQWLSIGLHATLFGHIDLLQTLAPPLLWRPEADDREMLQLCMSRLVHLQARAGTAAKLTGEGLGRAVFGLCWQMKGSPDLEDAATRNAPEWLALVLHQIRHEPRSTVQQLAALSGFSPAHFRRQFHGWFGLSPKSYLQRHQAEEARRFLEMTDLSINAVAQRCGFDSTSHFIRVFKLLFDVPPAQYRKLVKQAKAGELSENSSKHA